MAKRGSGATGRAGLTLLLLVVIVVSGAPTVGKGISLRPALMALVLVVLIPGSLVACRLPIIGDYGDLDINRLVSTYPLVIEGSVVGQTSGVNTEGQVDVPYTVFELEVAKYWKGNAGEPVLVTVPDDSRVALRPGEQYLLFLRDPVPGGEMWSGHRYLNATSLVWNVRGNTFLVTDAGGSCCLDPIAREELAEIIETNSE